ncbi:MAG: aldo/keto reductase [Firmicutes bacterium]|nr:aldo/keto reductase [Bacillota bacterium]
MKMVTLGSTGITVPQNGFGALPVQRRNFEDAAAILRRAYEGGMTFFDTARAYSDSEEKIGLALSDVRKNIYIATKTGAKTPDEMKAHIETSLKNMKTDYIDIYQFHFADQCYAPGDGTGMYETMEEFKRQGLIKHIGITCHKIGVAEECVKSGLYETIQFPLSYLSSPREVDLTRLCKEQNMGFIAMKAMAGGLINNSKAAFAYISQFDNVVPIWGIQKETELEEWLSFFDKPAVMDDEVHAFIEAEKKELDGNFCRGCGYCMPCPQGIKINNCARMSLMIRRAPSAAWLTDEWQENMKTAETCIECGSCLSKCPYELPIPELLKKNCEDYRKILAGEITV